MKKTTVVPFERIQRAIYLIRGEKVMLDTAIRSLFEAIRQLMEPPKPDQPKEIGFHVREDSLPYRITKRAVRNNN